MDRYIFRQSAVLSIVLSFIFSSVEAQPQVSIISPSDKAVYSIDDTIKIIANSSYYSNVISSNPNFPYLQINKPSGAWRKLKLGYDHVNLWNPKQNVILTGNDKLELTIKDIDGNLNWEKTEIHPQGYVNNPVILGNYLATAEEMANGWIKLRIPLADFDPGINFNAITYLELPYSKDDNPFTIAISRIAFTGGDLPFEWFGENKFDNIHNGLALENDNMLATLVSDSLADQVITKVSFYINDSLIGEELNEPYGISWIAKDSGNCLLKAVALASDNTIATSSLNFSVKEINAPPSTQVASVLSVVITFDSLPSNFQLYKASLRFNKKFAYSLTLDDGLISHYANAFQVLHGGTIGGETYPGLSYTDGCGNDISFKAGLAWYSVNKDGKDIHSGNTSGYMSWKQLDEVYDAGWDVLNHSFSHLNRGSSTNPYLPDSVYDYQVSANVSYTKAHTAEGIDLTHFVVPAGDDGYYNSAFKEGMKAVYDQLWSLPGNGGLLVNNNLNFDNFKLYRATMQDNLATLNSKIDDIARKTNSGSQHYWFNNFTHDIGTPAYSGGVQFSNFLANMSYISNTYGKNGFDVIWMAPLQEVYEYLQVRDAVVVNSEWKGNQLYLTFDISKVPSGLRRNELTLSVQSDVPFTDVKVNGAIQFSFNGTSPDNKLINLSWAPSTSSPLVLREPLAENNSVYSSNSQVEGFSIHPNPAEQYLSIRSLGFGTTPMKVNCYNLEGQCLISEMFSSVKDEFKLSLGNIPSGLYFIKIESESQVYKIEKFVKN